MERGEEKGGVQREEMEEGYLDDERGEILKCVRGVKGGKEFGSGVSVCVFRVNR